MQGFGLVVTHRGAPGAESKDCMVEAIEKLDPQAATAYTAHYTKGQGRHAKDGVRLGVGRVDLTTLVALTGPHQEVVQVTPTLIQGLHEGWSRPPPGPHPGRYPAGQFPSPPSSRLITPD